MVYGRKIIKRYSISLIWLLGLLGGSFLASNSRPLLVFGLGEVRIDTFFYVILTSISPIVFLFILLYFKKRLLLHIFVFIRAFLHNFCVTYLSLYGSIFLSGCCFLSASCCSFAILFLSMNNIESHKLPEMFVISILAMLIVSTVDYFLIHLLFL